MRWIWKYHGFIVLCIYNEAMSQRMVVDFNHHSTLQYPVCLLLFYAISTVFQIYHGGDMMYEMRRRKPKPALLPTQLFVNLPHHIGMV